METYMWWLVIAGAVLAAAFLAWGLVRRKRSRRLRERFDVEYDHAVSTSKSRRRAETELEEREERVRQYDIRPLMPEVQKRYAQGWQTIQTRFVDKPALAVAEADEHITEVMHAQGYPMHSFDEAAADLSVDYPQVVEHYRAARKIVVRSEQGQANTEELRQAMKHYRILLEELLGRPVKAPLVQEVRRLNEATAPRSDA